jgi:hypothetical protein
VRKMADDGKWRHPRLCAAPPVDAAGAAGGEVGCISSSILVKSGHVYTCLGNTCFHGRCILKCCGIYDMSNTPQRPDKKCNHMWLRNFIWAKSKIPTVLGWDIAHGLITLSINIAENKPSQAIPNKLLGRRRRY